MIGIGLALLGVTLTTVTGNGVWDAGASIAIGVLLMSIGLIVNRETQSLLVGESAAVEVVAAIREAIGSTEGVDAVVDLRTIHVGPDDLVVAAGIAIDPSRNASDIARAIVDAEARVRRVTPFRTVMYLEPRVRVPGEQSTPASGDGAKPDGSTPTT